MKSTRYLVLALALLLAPCLLSCSHPQSVVQRPTEPKPVQEPELKPEPTRPPRPEPPRVEQPVAPEETVEDKPDPPAGTTARLYVDTDPADATVKIMNIGPAFSQGMELKPDTYHVRVEKPGYKTYNNKDVVLKQGEDLRLNVPLTQVTQAPGSKTWTDPVTGMEFVWVPGGSFEMGCGSWTSDCDDEEKPVHSVSLKGFWLGKFEVTQAQWRKVMGDNPSWFKKGGDYPVERVSWDDVQKFIKALNAKGSAKFRLPSEAQWEYACRSGGKAEKYSGGSDVGRVAWYRDNAEKTTHPVGRKDPNGLGLHDMSGNVWEWVEDRWHGNYTGAPTDGSAWVSGGGSGDASERVSRGGSWNFYARGVRCADRYGYYPVYRYYIQGFRLLRTD